MWDLLLNTAGGAIAGALCSFVAPWANWGVERSRLRRESRSQLIREARELLLNPPPNTTLRHHPIYSRLRPHLSATSRVLVEGDRNDTVVIVAGTGRHSGVNPYAQHLLDELCALERQWKLI